MKIKISFIKSLTVLAIFSPMVTHAYGYKLLTCENAENKDPNCTTSILLRTADDLNYFQGSLLVRCLKPYDHSRQLLLKQFSQDETEVNYYYGQTLVKVDKTALTATIELGGKLQSTCKE